MNPTMERQRLADYEAYQRFEEMTDISERLGLPVETPIEFTVGSDGLVYSSAGDRFVEVVEKGYQAAQALAAAQPENAFAASRARHEADEMWQVEALARGELDGNCLLVCSPLPDAIRAGTSSLAGFNRERLRAMVRLYRAEGTTVTATTISLDRSDYAGLQAVMASVGFELPAGLSSEAMLAERAVFTATAEEAEWLPSLVRQSYDAALSRQYGGSWYAGSRFASKQDALSYVLSQSDLADQHMRALAAVQAQALAPQDKKLQLERLRQRFAAALDARLEGKQIHSLNDQAVIDQQATGDYSGDCPIDLSTTAQQLEAMGMRPDSLSCVKCPLPGCGKTVDASRTRQGGIFCPACRREARGGKIIDHNPVSATSQQLGRTAVSLLASLEQAIEEYKLRQAHKRQRRQLVESGATER